ncbi:OB-fold nucleic acid binding domain-containing protein [Methylobacterium sp. J-072]|uniref:OB-fold nucleic acid binding domain-containing protein n=1 Tax=Methylobacterium sp. J-072 TaxID=2836651 RepID=UPI001FB8B6D6|nr:OB-fold nucleic acid binding domain-containing protein [Methylobacterium sp. J-072]MCJ2092823.1 OB-fold nucleic acid binding domain-containing protein [Methylobacterium sp. J-072]
MIRTDGEPAEWPLYRVTLVLALLGAAAPARAAPGAAECRPESARTEIFDGVGLRGEIRLASGARIVLDSVRWPDAPGAAEAARAWLDARRGDGLVVVPRGPPDRWGRAHADIQVADTDIDLAGGLLGAGLAFADANERGSLCRPALRAVEDAARDKKLGLWRESTLQATDGPALRAQEGRFVVVEGRIRHVGERSARTYLDFVARGEDGLTVTVSKRTWRTMRTRGLSAASLEGRRVRVRGILEVWRGPTLEANADGVEILGEPDRREAGPTGERELRR